MRKLVFDNKLWNGKDVGDNSQFWKQAEILFISSNGTAKVKFDHDGRISEGHFVNAMKEISE
jgi:hypothetical protein